MKAAKTRHLAEVTPGHVKGNNEGQGDIRPKIRIFLRELLLSYLPAVEETKQFGVSVG